MKRSSTGYWYVEYTSLGGASHESWQTLPPGTWRSVDKYPTNLRSAYREVQNARDEDDTHPHLRFAYRLRNARTNQIIMVA